jgi:calcineurin-like phosphoesterase family protein
MYYFSSDLHFGDERLNLYGRDFIAKNATEIDELIINNWNSLVKPNDKAFLLGDICYDKSKLELINRLNGYKYLVKGNYDDDIEDTTWLKYFEEVYDSLYIKINSNLVFLNHYPTNGKADCFNICGHIHGTWKVQRNMINVGVDAWHLFPVSLDRIKFQMNGIKNHYDENVFIGDNIINKKTKIK